jgi:hypothetical protein
MLLLFYPLTKDRNRVDPLLKSCHKISVQALITRVANLLTSVCLCQKWGIPESNLDTPGKT